MKQNLDIYDFTLSDEDMSAIAHLDTGKSLFFDHHAPEVVKMFMGLEITRRNTNSHPPPRNRSRFQGGVFFEKSYGIGLPKTKFGHKGQNKQT